MSHEHYAKPDSHFFIPDTWKGLAVELVLALPMPTPDAVGGVGVTYPGQNGVLRDVMNSSLEIEDNKRVLCLPKSRIWALSVIDDGVDRLPTGVFGHDGAHADAGFYISEDFVNQPIDIALALPVGVEGLGGRKRIEYPRQNGTMAAIFTTSVVIRYEQVSKGERQKRLMLLPKSRIWTISRPVEAA